MGRSDKKATAKSLKPKTIKTEAAAKVRGGGEVVLKKLPGKRTPPTVTLK